MLLGHYSSTNPELVEGAWRNKMSNEWKWYVYIIECLDKSYYTGCTWSISDRLEQHVSKLGSKYTAKHGVNKLAYYEEHNDLEVARNREQQIKGWSREKKEQLINGKWKKDW